MYISITHLPNGLFPLDFPYKILHNSLELSLVLHAQPISPSSILGYNIICADFRASSHIGKTLSGSR
jgi:hypothetical protein